jgi:hypothetical protein
MIGISWWGSLDVHAGFLMSNSGPCTGALVVLVLAPVGSFAKPSHCSVTIEYPFQPGGSENVKPYLVFRYTIDVACLETAAVVGTGAVVGTAAGVVVTAAVVAESTVLVEDSELVVLLATGAVGAPVPGAGWKDEADMPGTACRS